VLCSCMAVNVKGCFVRVGCGWRGAASLPGTHWHLAWLEADSIVCAPVVLAFLLNMPLLRWGAWGVS
jgi:hypothetical protein